MYQAKTHKDLSQLLDQLDKKAATKKISPTQLRDFYARLSANYSFISQRYQTLYGEKSDVAKQLNQLFELLFDQYVKRSADLKALDENREQDPDWLQSQKWVGVTLYADHFAENLKNLSEKIPYLKELGINCVHLMPLLKSPTDASDGGYSVSDYRKVNPKLGTLKDLNHFAKELRQNDMLLTLDLVVNHTSDQHQWARKARQGVKKYQNYYYCYPDRTVPNEFEKSLPEIFPTSAPGNFTYNKKIDRWIMTVFHDYQWDLNYRNPEVLTAMLDNLLFLADQGADIIRLDAPAFLWKEIGTTSQNLPETHLLLQLMRACTEIVAPGVKLLAEAIVAPEEIVKYLGTGHSKGHECHMAYHATMMALLWEAIATGETRLVYKVLSALPEKPQNSTLINYLRCHDDIGLGFHDRDIYEIGLDARLHRQYLIDYYSGKFPGSPATGAPFMANAQTGDARISGSMASLSGLERAIKSNGHQGITQAVQKILMLHSIILSYGGLPMIHSGDEIGQLNDYTYLDHPEKAYDNRWMHRAQFNWDQAALRKDAGTVANSIFSGVQKLIKLRKSLPIISDFNTCTLEYCENKHILAFLRGRGDAGQLLILCNFFSSVQFIRKEILYQSGFDPKLKIVDLYLGKAPKYHDGLIEFQPYQFYWLQQKEQKTKK
ncbi:MAG: alpha-amylase family protein [Cyclobacteriaceae bacterium]